MQTPLDLLQAAATSEIDLGGIRFRCRRITSRDLDGYRGYQLLVMGVPDAMTRARPGFLERRYWTFMNRSIARCEPAGSMPLMLPWL